MVRFRGGILRQTDSGSELRLIIAVVALLFCCRGLGSSERGSRVEQRRNCFSWVELFQGECCPTRPRPSDADSGRIWQATSPVRIWQYFRGQKPWEPLSERGQIELGPAAKQGVPESMGHDESIILNGRMSSFWPPLTSSSATTPDARLFPHRRSTTTKLT